LRALVISDSHFGAWTGEDILREPATLALLEPCLDVDEVIFLGDMFDLLFGPLRESLSAARGLLGLLREKLQGKRFVFLAGNHDHHYVARELEDLVELELVAGKDHEQLRAALGRADVLRRFLATNLEGVDVDLRYPAYTFAGVLCTHGHYLDLHASRTGARSGRLLGRALWSIAVGGEQRAPTIQDYEATVTMLSGLLYTVAQLPNGTNAQRRVFDGFQDLGRALRRGGAPVRALEEVRNWSAAHLGGLAHGRTHPGTNADSADYQGARTREMMRRRRTGAPAGGEASSFAFARTVAPSDPSGPAVEAFEKAVLNLGWSREADKIVFAHTHQPLDGVTGPGGAIRYWNTGSWIYEPDLRSREAYMSYLRNAWPGTAVLIDSDEPEPRLLRLREHLNPLRQGLLGPNSRPPPVGQ
jgi:UDP-2,3-diacylglucosamine pyrophosphatase LpxH